VKPRMGRPPLPRGEARAVVFTLRLTDEERDALDRAAKLAGKPVTQWARETLVACAGFAA
jgi:uncharacterized protein (DUF1778 family)